MKRDSGFTLVEVLVALLLGAVGLLGTLAVQQAVISASKAANDSAVALRLASQRLEEFNTYLTTGDPANVPSGTAPLPCGPPSGTNLPYCDQLRPVSSAPPGTWSNSVYLNAEGAILGGSPTAATPAHRWTRRERVVNTGFGLPYVISVAVTYSSDTGTAKTVQLDMERRKSWQ
jgi:prepilin-type N-terminal cleavage/methylation domain-containing protein